MKGTSHLPWQPRGGQSSEVPSAHSSLHQWRLGGWFIRRAAVDRFPRGPEKGAPSQSDRTRPPAALQENFCREGGRRVAVRSAGGPKHRVGEGASDSPSRRLRPCGFLRRDRERLELPPARRGEISLPGLGGESAMSCVEIEL